MMLWAFVIPLHSATVNAIYNSPLDIPISAASYNTAGNDIQFVLNFPTPTGINLTVIRCTGLNFIQGEFSNLSHGQTVTLNHGGQNYYFTANYYGNAGRDLVLQWANTKPVAWGNGANGKLGNGLTANRSVAVTVNTADALWGKSPVTGSPGENHSLGLCSDGTVVSWGLNENGQLGNNSTIQSDVPVGVTISGVPASRTVAAISAGANHSLALCSDGTVVSWGLNGNGQLGNNSMAAQSKVPVAVTSSGALSGKSVVAISAGANHSLALCSDGTVVSWGLNADGQLGNNSTDQSRVPVVVSASGVLATRTVVAISAGANHSLALCSDGTVVSWGLNANGQLGNNSTSQSTVPVAVTTASGALLGKFVTMVSAGGSHNLALCSDGALVAWGRNADGQLGNSNNSQSNIPVGVVNSGVLNGKSVFMVSAGAAHSLAHCTDGTVTAWGLGTSGQLGSNNFSSSNVPVAAEPSSLDFGIFSGVISGSSASHSLSLVAQPEIELSNCGFHKQITYDQSSIAEPTLDPDSPYSFNCYVQPGTMGTLLSSSTLTPPPGSTGAAIFENGSNGLQMFRTFRTKSALDAAFTTGTYFLDIKTSTPSTYHVGINLGSDNYPSIPKITSLTNATWVGGALKVTNPALDVTISWNNPGANFSYFQIDNTDINSGGGASASSFTIPGNSLSNDSSFRASVQLSNYSSGNPVPGVPGVYSNSGYQTQVQFVILTGNASAVSNPFYLLLKSHNQVQSSNSDPVDSPNHLPDSDLAPYSLTAECPVGGTLTGPASTSFSLDFRAENDGALYQYLSGLETSSSALNTSHPNGTYIFPGGVSVNLTGDGYPGTAKILTVNGNTPIWDAQGELALDPTIENTITWSDVIVPDFATHGHQSVFLENYQDYNFESIEMETGILTGIDAPITSMSIPKFTLTAAFTYIGNISYVAAPTVTDLGGDSYAVGAYETGNYFVVVALKPQTITFDAIPAKLFPTSGFSLSASASSGLPVTYSVVSGPATVSGNSVTLTGVGEVVIQASQAGTGVYASAMSVTQSFTVTYASLLAEFRAVNGLASDGSQDLLTPANDGNPNLLKFAFNMIGTGPGQASALAVPNIQIVGMSGEAGLPRQGMDAGKLTVTYIRRKVSSTPGVTYAVEFSNNLSTGSWAVNTSATEVVAYIDADFERVTVTDSVVAAKRFARVRVSTN